MLAFQRLVVVAVVVTCYYCSCSTTATRSTCVVESWSPPLPPPSRAVSWRRSSPCSSSRQQPTVQLKNQQRRGRFSDDEDDGYEDVDVVDEERHCAAAPLIVVDGEYDNVDRHHCHHQRHNGNNHFLSDRRSAILSSFSTTTAAVAVVATATATSSAAFAETTTAVSTTTGGSSEVDDESIAVEVTPSSSDARKLFNEGRALESQGNMAAAQRLYVRVTQISPRFIYGWANLANTQVALGDLGGAENNYSKAIKLCQLSNGSDSSSSSGQQQGFGVKKCNDLYVLLLNRGSVRLNNGQPKDALQDLQQSSILRGRPDAVIAQNLARAKEMNGLYGQADKDYTMAISMTANEVNPFWLRSAMVKLQLGDIKGGKDLLARVENRFPDAPEVKAASATFLLLQQQQQQKSNASVGEDEDDGAAAAAARRKFLEIPNKQRLRFSDNDYLRQVISWPPAMIEGVKTLAKAVGDV